MRKIFLSLFLFVLLFLTGPLVHADSTSADQNIPEKNGTYDDPGHPGIKVRVFVHEPKVQQSVVQTQCTDSSSTAVDHATGWHLPNGAWTYRLNVSSVPGSVGSVNLPTIAANAFSQWGGAQNRVTFTAGANTNVSRSAYDGQNVVAWGHTSGQALAVTYTRYNTSTHETVDVDTIMNSKYAWVWNQCGSSNAYDAQDILTHELGHWMGLDDEYTSAYTENTMYGYGSKDETKKDTITVGDAAEITSIYP